MRIFFITITISQKELGCLVNVDFHATIFNISFKHKPSAFMITIRQNIEEKDGVSRPAKL